MTAIIIIGIIIGILSFFTVLRDLFCWYYKINEQIEISKKTNDLLADILKQIKGEQTDNVIEVETEKMVEEQKEL